MARTYDDDKNVFLIKYRIYVLEAHFPINVLCPATSIEI
jgi:hypothetical protein